MARKPLLDARSRVPAFASQYRQGDFALQRIEVVPQRTARDRLPVAIGREGFDLILDPREADWLAEVEVSLGGIADPDARGHGDFGQVQGAVQFLERGDARGQLFRYMLLQQLRAQRVHARLLR